MQRYIGERNAGRRFRTARLPVLLLLAPAILPAGASSHTGRDVLTSQPASPYCTLRIPQSPLALPNEAVSRNR